MTELAGRKLLRADAATGATLSALGAAALVASLAMPTFEERNADPLTAPGIFPAFVSIVLLILGLRMLLRSLARLKEDSAKSLEPSDGTGIAWKTLLTGFSLMLATVALLGVIPFKILVSAFCLAFAGVFLIGRGSARPGPARLAAIGFVVVLSGYVIPTLFERVFFIRLP